MREERVIRAKLHALKKRARQEFVRRSFKKHAKTCRHAVRMEEVSGLYQCTNMELVKGKGQVLCWKERAQRCVLHEDAQTKAEVLQAFSTVWENLETRMQVCPEAVVLEWVLQSQSSGELRGLRGVWVRLLRSRWMCRFKTYFQGNPASSNSLS